ncbi:MAG: hypothetical protein SOZ65_06755 [Erysipelotrichaceae bacterium]|nr:hypothetical protein [Erysipelotrichaceae bacterium]
MAKIDFSKMKESLSKTVDLAKEQASKIVDAAKDINVNDMKESIVNAANEVYDKAVHFDPNQAKQDVVQMAKDTKQKMEQFNKNVKENKKRVKEIIQQKEDEEFRITVVDSLQIIYAIMKADGELSQQEQNMFENIGKQIDETFIDDKTMIETVVGSHFKNDIDNDSYVVASINSAIINSKNKKERGIKPKHLLLNLLSMAFCDGISEKEAKAIRYFASELNIDDCIDEFSQSILALSEIENQQKFMTDSNRQYYLIKENLEQLQLRRDVISTNLQSLIDD